MKTIKRVWKWSIIVTIVVLVCYLSFVYIIRPHFYRIDLTNKSEATKYKLFNGPEVSYSVAKIFTLSEKGNSNGGIVLIDCKMVDLAIDLYNFENKFRTQANLTERPVWLYEPISLDTLNMYSDQTNLEFGDYIDDWFLFLRYELEYADPFKNGSNGKYAINTVLFQKKFQQIYGMLLDRDKDGDLDVLFMKPPQIRWINKLDTPRQENRDES